MMFAPRTRYALISAAILVASVVQLINGYRPLIVVIAAVTFLFVGNLIVYLSGSKERAIRKRQKQEYWAGN
jgi:Flp pilus assembly protein TadB